ncbi:hypothetical protein QA601_13055, partial [Chitinispirillales bacterium ANBcel5]|uniref:hypothetical protein n=1 Tax=Cellulosispirillum alkaliphilum TaxID=3039283 RepID=UPI002A5032D7|nr:hypothetical protein [Chitinispirillales bacterium ANBcel5]
GYPQPVSATRTPQRVAPSQLSLNAVSGKPGSVELRYSLSKPGRVTIDLYDLRGKRVEQVLNKPRGAGDHTVRFSGGSGFYVAEIRVEHKGGVMSAVERVLVR